MRIDRKKIEELTHRKRIKSQVEWFRQNLGVDVPFDHYGIIITESALNKLVEKRLGILPIPSDLAGSRPSVRLRKEQT